MEIITLKQIDKLLEYHTIDAFPVLEVGGEFNRKRRFNIEGNEWRIVWYKNICYLENNNQSLIIPFEQVKLTNTWPTRSKMNLQFYYQGEVCCVLKIEDFDQ